MRIDSTHKPWLIATLVVTVIATVAYISYHLSSAHAPSGGSALGLTFGIAAAALMGFAGLLGLRKKFPIWRIGRAQTWMRGHLWLGLLSLPLILFHSGFAFGGTLSTLLMALFLLVLASGVLGAVLQHYLPRSMTEQLPLETIFEQIESVRRQLLEEADALVAPVIGPAETASKVEKASAGEKEEVSEAQPANTIPEESVARLRAFYAREMRPFLEKPSRRRNSLADARQSANIFKQLRVFLPPPLDELLDDLADICEEERQLTRQARLHHLLHTWLVVHVPLSYAVLVLTAAHAWMALKF